MALTERQHTGEFILSEANGSRSRENVTVTVPANTTLEAGHVLGKITATGKYTDYDNGASDGTQAAAGLLYAEQVNDTGAPVDVEAAALVRDAEVHRGSLQWEATQDASAKTAAYADLLALGIVVRD